MGDQQPQVTDAELDYWTMNPAEAVNELKYRNTRLMREAERQRKEIKRLRDIIVGPEIVHGMHTVHASIRLPTGTRVGCDRIAMSADTVQLELGECAQQVMDCFRTNKEK